MGRIQLQRYLQTGQEVLPLKGQYLHRAVNTVGQDAWLQSQQGKENPQFQGGLLLRQFPSPGSSDLKFSRLPSKRFQLSRKIFPLRALKPNDQLQARAQANLARVKLNLNRHSGSAVEHPRLPPTLLKLKSQL
jgi:hypothetical protein